MRTYSRARWLLRLAAALIAFTPSRAAAVDRSIASRIAAIQNGLDPPVVIFGEPAKKWSITMQMHRLKVPAVSVAVINNYKIEWARAWGVTEARGKRAATIDTLFQAASISKPVTAMAVMHLVQQGKLHLDSDVNEQLRTWKVHDNEFTRARPVTLRELLSHSAGIPVYGYTGYDAHRTLPTLQQVLDGVPPADTPAVTVEGVPGRRWQYSGGGYEIVQQMVIDVTGESFPDFMRTTLLQPLGMSHSTFEQPLPGDLQADAAAGTLADGTELPGKWRVFPQMMSAGLWTTPSDIARFAIALMNTKRGQGNSVISAATAAVMLTPQITTSSGFGQGLGVLLAGDPGAARFSHAGDTPGFKAIMAGYFSGRGVVVMANSDNGLALALEIIRAVEREYGWNL